MATDIIRDDSMGKFIAYIKAYGKENPTVSFAKLYKAFVTSFSNDEQHALELDYVAQEYSDEVGEPLPGKLADIFSLIQVLALNPSIVFDDPHVFQSASQLVLGMNPNYAEALYSPAFQYAEAYVVLCYLLKVPHDLSPLSTEVADVIAMSVYKDGTDYFPDRRVVEGSLPELLDGANTALKFRLKKTNELIFDHVLPAIYSSKGKVEFAKKLKVILDEDKGRTNLMYKALPMTMLTASTFYQVRDALKNK